jgi:hypothetical protein
MPINCSFIYFFQEQIEAGPSRRPKPLTQSQLSLAVAKAKQRKSFAEDLLAAAADGFMFNANLNSPPRQSDGLPPELPEHHYLSLSDLTVTFKSVVGQKLLQGCSANSIDTLMELDLAARNNRPLETRNSLVQTDLGLI